MRINSDAEGCPNCGSLAVEEAYDEYGLLRCEDCGEHFEWDDTSERVDTSRAKRTKLRTNHYTWDD